MKWSVGILKNNMSTLKWACAIIAVVVGYFVLTSVPIIIIISVSIFMAVLIGFSMICLEKESIAFVESLTRKPSKILAKAWLPVLVWLALAVWTLWTVFR